MATRGTIAVEKNDGTVMSIYSHYDNYLQHNVKLLVEYYNSQELAEALITGGDISSLAERINPIGEHSFYKRENGTTVYYKRDRGETGVEPRKFVNIDQYLLTNEPEKFNYIFTEGDDKDGNRVTGWFVSFGESKRFQLVVECLAECMGE